MHQTRSEATAATTDPPAMQPPSYEALDTPAKVRWFIYSLTAGIGKSEVVEESHRLFDATHKPQPTAEERIKELEQRCQALESMVDTLTELLVYGPQTDAQ